jgi:S-DNA-T family DNA segregation ATPase FtsK/SpoIIIE
MLLPLPIGVDTFGDPIVIDLAECPHLLIAGATGSGKSIAIHSLILSLLAQRSGDKLGLLLIDAKAVELSQYHGVPHLIGRRVAVNSHEAIQALTWLVNEVENRYTRMMRRKARSAQEIGVSPIVAVIDELADLMVSAKQRRLLETLITRIAQKARAAGVYMVVATQRPSTNVVTGVMKANLPARLSFRLPSLVDSRTILDVGGAESLLGAGDGLFLGAGLNLTRLQAPFVSTANIQCMVKNSIAKSKHPSLLAGPMGFWSRLRQLLEN